jgi:hypothetical protein
MEMIAKIKANSSLYPSFELYLYSTPKDFTEDTYYDRIDLKEVHIDHETLNYCNDDLEKKEGWR